MNWKTVGSRDMVYNQHLGNRKSTFLEIHSITSELLSFKVRLSLKTYQFLTF